MRTIASPAKGGNDFSKFGLAESSEDASFISEFQKLSDTWQSAEIWNLSAFADTGEWQ
jgi:hypothetical protein